MQPQWAHTCSRCLTPSHVTAVDLPVLGWHCPPISYAGRLIANETMWEGRDLGEEDWWYILENLEEWFPLFWRERAHPSPLHDRCTKYYNGSSTMKPWTARNYPWTFQSSKRNCEKETPMIYKSVNLKCFVTITQTTQHRCLAFLLQICHNFLCFHGELFSLSGLIHWTCNSGKKSKLV